jgi:hypothetical protein
MVDPGKPRVLIGGKDPVGGAGRGQDISFCENIRVVDCVKSTPDSGECPGKSCVPSLDGGIGGLRNIDCFRVQGDRNAWYLLQGVSVEKEECRASAAQVCFKIGKGAHGETTPGCILTIGLSTGPHIARADKRDHVGPLTERMPQRAVVRHPQRTPHPDEDAVKFS